MKTRKVEVHTLLLVKRKLLPTQWLTLQDPIPPPSPPHTQIMLLRWKLIPWMPSHWSSSMMSISVPCRVMGRSQVPNSHNNGEFSHLIYMVVCVHWIQERMACTINVGKCTCWCYYRYFFVKWLPWKLYFCCTVLVTTVYVGSCLNFTCCGFTNVFCHFIYKIR